MMENKNPNITIRIVPWNEPTDLREPSFDAVLRNFEIIMLNAYVGLLPRDPQSIRIDRSKVKLAIPQEYGATANSPKR